MKAEVFYAYRRGWIETMELALRAANDDKEKLRRRITELESRLSALDTAKEERGK